MLSLVDPCKCPDGDLNLQLGIWVWHSNPVSNQTIISSNRFLIPCSLPSPLVPLWCGCCYSWYCPKNPLDFLALLGCSQLSCPLIHWFNHLLHLTCYSFLLVYSSIQIFYLHFWLVPFYGFYVLFNAYYLFKFSLISPSLPLRSLSVLITTVLNSASGIMVASISLNSFQGPLPPF